MKNSLLLIFLLLAVGQSIAQTAPDLGAASTFTLFTSVGALKNNGASKITGDAGTNSGAITGFENATMTGTIYGPTTTAASNAAAAMPNAYASFGAADEGTLLTSPLGGTTALAPGTYRTVEAATLTGNLILDGGGATNPIFIIKINGAFTTSTASNLILTGGATLSNVFFRVNGAVSLGINSTFRGTIVAGGTGDAAIELLTGAKLFGKALTAGGAITLNNNEVNQVDTVLPVTLASFNVKKEGNTASLTWTTTAEMNSDVFEVEHSVNGKTWLKRGSVNASGESSQSTSYSYTDALPEHGVNLYRLKMIDKDFTFAYSRIRNVEFNIVERTSMYPNPVVDRLTLDVDDISLVTRIQLTDITGRPVFDKSRSSGNLSDKLDVSTLPSGMYVARITRNQGAIAYLNILKL